MKIATKRYIVGTNGLTGNCSYQANNPDEALLYAYKHEKFTRLISKYPSISMRKASKIIEDERYEMPDFRIDYCILDLDH